jgi:hypothetical protein
LSAAVTVDDGVGPLTILGSLLIAISAGLIAYIAYAEMLDYAVPVANLSDVDNIAAGMQTYLIVGLLFLTGLVLFVSGRLKSSQIAMSDEISQLSKTLTKHQEELRKMQEERIPPQAPNVQ